MRTERTRAEAAEKEVEQLRVLLHEIAEDATGGGPINPGLDSVQAVLYYFEKLAAEKALAHPPEIELDSPPSTPPQLEEFKARGYKRINREKPPEPDAKEGK